MLVSTVKKILPLEELAEKSFELKALGRQVVLCHGTFDLMHTGHIRYLQKAKDKGDFLFVTVTGDKFVNKGPGRPVFSEQLRAEALAALACVDFVSVNQAETAVSIISMIKPQIYAKGQEYKIAENDATGNIIHERNAVESYGGEITFTEDITFSSTELLNEHFGIFPPATRDYLYSFRENYSHQKVIKSVQSLKGLKVLVIGDAIVDEYHYTEPMGHSIKGNHLAVKYESMEQFAGGSLAVANHLAGFLENVTLITTIGKNDDYEHFIRSKLLPNIKPVFSYRENVPTIVKRRFVDGDMNKLFEVYFFNKNPSFDDLDKEICPWLEREVEKFDVVMVPDFGNGFISLNMVEILCRKARYLAVNTQMNSGNQGYHVITRYPRADFVSLNEPEVRLAGHNRHDSVEKVASRIGNQVGSQFIAITQGTKGAFMLNLKQSGKYQAPALSTKVLDRVGAGDTFFAFAGLCLGGNLAPELAIFVGSATAALDVQIVCNREPIRPSQLYNYVGTLLK